ncbi:hypothetical protein CBR_g61470 [Chara braunii]|uniref:Amine oxidase domain-containing protein n=1 Tax=Chara braunii TaxID=69332 RepID=A0A388K8T2_CHABU|nr:hypothetical protein CBR_g61470 [Chara braunii]|eukprot:GBG66426.1 hypothetical protein CBR_g61470 [Chara braunii]
MRSWRHVAAYRSPGIWSPSVKPGCATFFVAQSGFFARLLDGHRHRHSHRDRDRDRDVSRKESESDKRRTESSSQCLARGGRLREDGCHRHVSRGGRLWEDGCHRQSFPVEGRMKNGGSGSGWGSDGDQPKKTVAIIGAGIAGVEVKYGCYVGSFRRESDDEGRAGGHWILKSTDEIDLGKYHALVISDKNLSNERFTALTGLPPPLEFAGVPDMKKKMESVLSRPCFALMLAFRQPLEQVPFDGATIEGSDLISWAARDSSKPRWKMTFDDLKDPPKKLDLECWVVHSTAEYAAKRIAEAPKRGKPSAELLASVGDELFREFKTIIDADAPEPCFMKAHRWGGAFPTTAAAPEGGCLADSAMQIFACGDFCTGPRIDLAIWSGLSAAKAASASLQKTPRL